MSEADTPTSAELERFSPAPVERRDRLPWWVLAVVAVAFWGTLWAIWVLARWLWGAS